MSKNVPITGANAGLGFDVGQAHRHRVDEGPRRAPRPPGPDCQPGLHRRHRDAERGSAATTHEADVQYVLAVPRLVDTRPPWHPAPLDPSAERSSHLDRPFDRHLLGTTLRVVASDGRVIAGTSHVGENETSCSFIPEEPWASCGVRVAVDGGLEDVAGNSFRGVLDRELNTAVGRRLRSGGHH